MALLYLLSFLQQKRVYFGSSIKHIQYPNIKRQKLKQCIRITFIQTISIIPEEQRRVDHKNTNISVKTNRKD